MKQETIDRVTKMLNFCRESKTRKEVSKHLGVSEQTITTYGAKYHNLFRVDQHHHQVYSGLWVKSYLSIAQEFSLPPRKPVVHDKVKLKVRRPDDNWIAAMFGYTDHEPTSIPSMTHSEKNNLPPPPRVRVHQRVYVSGSTLSAFI